MTNTIDAFGCVRNTIKVVAGHYIDLADPLPDLIDVPTIAAALSKICRFGGHCPRFYSVAEHCVLATTLAAPWNSDYTLRAILLHDAAEAYIGDVVKPLKIMLPDYAIIEQRMQTAIEDRFGISFSERETEIKHFDRLMLKAEKLAMWPDDREAWSGFDGLPDVTVSLFHWEPREAEMQFLALARTLQIT